jgi:hypothetical protein
VWIAAARREDIVRASRTSGALLVLGVASAALGDAELGMLLRLRNVIAAK